MFQPIGLPKSLARRAIAGQLAPQLPTGKQPRLAVLKRTLAAQRAALAAHRIF